MDDGDHSEAVPPGGGEVADVHAGVLVGGAAGPAKQSLLCGGALRLSDHDVRDLGGIIGRLRWEQSSYRENI